ncbi:MAG: hypothetical protein ACTMHL_07460 [Janibacter sp.]
MIDRDRKLVGMLWEGDVAAAVRARQEALPLIPRSEVATAAPGALLADMFRDASVANSPVCVLADDGRLIGTVPHATLLAAASGPEEISDMADEPEAQLEMGEVR